ncbi:sulfur compound chelating protein SoxZ [Magnetococcus marinus MC-1]|uniref:Sulfur compound chelating protein SoxZ n=1 Tax=Magnetococcus marinus (strain ATCC BAA-1437 / JCM 17883 / MC-1) TaxID=156889 RepID=A0LBZ6_MAGMM|nr:thiosulfate oxidation carrier complex protein SoxZ [Magnetococcus marinus]ABK45489.1 sulfur compound chelating protein SoxZ [Magnetococcus marinus MC-1]
MANIGSPKVRGPNGAVSAGSMVDVKTLIKHPMESGFRKDRATGETYPAHYVAKVEVNYLGNTVISAEWSGGVSKNPFYSFSLKATKSGPVEVTWTDNKGESWNEKFDLTVA